MKNPIVFLKVSAAMLKLVRDPGQVNAVLAILETMAVDPKVLAEMAEELGRTPEGASALREQPRLPEIDVQALLRMPKGTLGRVFAEHVSANGLDPNLFRRKAPQSSHEFIMVHLAESHDVWHVMTGFGVDANGELGLQAFYLAQLPSRFAIMFMVCTLLNVLFFSFGTRAARMRMIARGWVLGSRARSLFGVRWSDLWLRPLSELRRAFGIDVASADVLLPAVVGDEKALPAMLLRQSSPRIAA